jgi:hydrogenase nickel incorporation protein HypA/HybF
MLQHDIAYSLRHGLESTNHIFELISQMHELSIALSIIDIAEQEVIKHEAKEVVEIELEIGKLSGIEPYALDFAWDQAIINTVLEKAQRKTRYIEARAVCQDCGHEFEIDNVYDECPSCQSYMKELKSGRELRVKSLTVI